MQAIASRHRSELMQVPHVYIVGVGGKGILVGVHVYTDSQGKKPTTLPAALDALPADVEGLPLQLHPLYVLPPPPGVTILRPNGVREAAEACPRAFVEYSQFGWTFCIDRRNPQPIPDSQSISAMMTPPIAGIPYEECLKILERHRDDLMQLDGVKGVGIGSEGISVYTSNPDIVPSELEGLPVKTKFTLGASGASHTSSNPPVRPLHGGVEIGISGSTIRGTLTGVVLSEGKPWLVFPTHLLASCDVPSPCPPASASLSSVLNTCPHNVGVSGTQEVLQPELSPPAVSPTAGFAQRWDPLQPGQSTTDIAAAFMDNDVGILNEGNGSLRANREQEQWMGNFGFPGIDRPNPPLMNEIVSIVTNNNPHVFFVGVIEPSVNMLVKFGCINSQIVLMTHQMILLTDLTDEMPFPPPPVPITEGDSGAAVLDGAGGLVGMLNWKLLDNPFIGGGTIAPQIRQQLNFDFWYGTLSVKDNTFGVWRTNSSGAGTWELDNGDGRWNGCVTGSTQTTEDKDLCLFAGIPGDLPITGDWTNPDNDPTTETKQVGVIRPTTSFVFLDRNNNGWNSSEGCTIDQCAVWGDTTPNDLAIAGDWDGDGLDEIGRWNPPGSWWTLDDGDLVWEECGGFAAGADECATFGIPSDRPAVGDWNNDGKDEIGVYRPGSGTWLLDANGNRTWDGCGTDLCLGPFGLSGDLPLAGDWTGTGGDKIGVFQPYDPFGSPYKRFVLDNGNGVFVSVEQEQILGPFGLETDKVIVWNQSVIKAN